MPESKKAYHVEFPLRKKIKNLLILVSLILAGCNEPDGNGSSSSKSSSKQMTSPVAPCQIPSENQIYVAPCDTN